MTHWSGVDADSKSWTTTGADAKSWSQSASENTLAWTRMAAVVDSSGGIDFAPMWSAKGDGRWSSATTPGFWWALDTFRSSKGTFNRNP